MSRSRNVIQGSANGSFILVLIALKRSLFCVIYLTVSVGRYFDINMGQDIMSEWERKVHKNLANEYRIT